METNFNLKEALKETKKRYSLEEKAEIILQIIISKMKEQDIDADTVTILEIKCKRDSPSYLNGPPQRYEIIASVTDLAGSKREMYRTNLTLINLNKRKILMDRIVMQVKQCNFSYNLFNDYNGEITLRIRL